MDIDFGSKSGKLILAGIALIALGIFYFIWTKSAAPDPVLPPGQSLSNPMGNASNDKAHKKQ